MNGKFVKTWAQVSMGVLFCLLIAFGFFVLSR
jgi:hypothetical protein